MANNYIKGISVNILLLGIVSFWNDLSSEMVMPILPIWATEMTIPVKNTGESSSGGYFTHQLAEKHFRSPTLWAYPNNRVCTGRVYEFSHLNSVPHDRNFPPQSSYEGGKLLLGYCCTAHLFYCSPALIRRGELRSIDITVLGSFRFFLLRWQTTANSYSDRLLITCAFDRSFAQVPVWKMPKKYYFSLEHFKILRSYLDFSWGQR